MDVINLISHRDIALSPSWYPQALSGCMGERWNTWAGCVGARSIVAAAHLADIVRCYLGSRLEQCDSANSSSLSEILTPELVLMTWKKDVLWFIFFYSFKWSWAGTITVLFLCQSGFWCWTWKTEALLLDINIWMGSSKWWGSCLALLSSPVSP